MLVQLADITFGYSGETLFEGLTWQINEGDHVGLVAFGGGATWGATLARWTLPVYPGAGKAAAAGAGQAIAPAAAARASSRGAA